MRLRVPYSPRTAMATLDNFDLVQQIIDADSYRVAAGLGDPNEPQDPIAVRITEYTNYEGNTCWGVVFHNEPIDRYQIETAYVRRPKIIWERGES